MQVWGRSPARLAQDGQAEDSQLAVDAFDGRPAGLQRARLQQALGLRVVADGGREDQIAAA